MQLKSTNITELPIKGRNFKGLGLLLDVKTQTYKKFALTKKG